MPRTPTDYSIPDALQGQFQIIAHMGIEDAQHLQEKDASYGSSWRKRGGVGAFMMLARKWDRLEQMCSAAGYDIFKLIEEELQYDPSDPGRPPEAILDQLRDLRRYLFLVDSWMQMQCGNPYTSPHRSTEGDGNTPEVLIPPGHNPPQIADAMATEHS